MAGVEYLGPPADPKAPPFQGFGAPMWRAEGYENTGPTLDDWIAARDEDGFVDDKPRGIPYRCPRCGTTRLEVAYTASYETSMRCPDCKVFAVVHDG